MEIRNDIGLERACRDIRMIESGRNDWSELAPSQRAAFRREVRRRVDITERWVEMEVARLNGG